ncbi:hypothetical protein DKX38_007462 [Salix brachista]|uniref:Uncharacterized protein n=1 Tax=Salix brachista TaxID=2182728 RepID=A0A5N5MQ70_9ROSI|nr:hypothetical protein DKX38_007462 [Salix brachista]
MARRRVKKTVTESAPSNQENQPQIEEPKHFPFIDQEVERQIAAIRAMRDVEIEHLVTELRLLRSYFNGANINASLLRRLSLAYPGCSANLSVGRFGLSSDAVKTSIFGATDNWQKTGIVLEGQSDSQMLGMHDGIRTPGVTSQRQSIGMTPKTQRLPKRGEILLSVRGSPLGVYKEDNMEAINGYTKADKFAGLSQAGVSSSTSGQKFFAKGMWLQSDWSS